MGRKNFFPTIKTWHVVINAILYSSAFALNCVHKPTPRIFSRHFHCEDKHEERKKPSRKMPKQFFFVLRRKLCVNTTLIILRWFVNEKCAFRFIFGWGPRREFQASFRRVAFKLKFRRHIFSEGKVKVIRHFTFSNLEESNRLNVPAMIRSWPYALSLVFSGTLPQTPPETSPEASLLAWLLDKPIRIDAHFLRNSKTFMKKPQNWIKL